MAEYFNFLLGEKVLHFYLKKISNTNINISHFLRYFFKINFFLKLFLILEKRKTPFKIFKTKFMKK